MLLNNQWTTKEIKVEIKRYLVTNENKSMKMYNLWGTAKAVPWGKFIAIKSQINNLILHLKQPEKEEQKIQS